MYIYRYTGSGLVNVAHDLHEKKHKNVNTRWENQSRQI